MLTTIFVVLAVIVILLIAAWFFLDLDVTDVAVPVIAPATGACIIYFYYDTPAAWAVGLGLLALGAIAIYLAVRRRRRRDVSRPLN
jgi:LPXTG-motif cell wall-anchored protein